ncbi:MAG: DUF427 domain-containing protein [Pseudomonadota bacterium]
MADVEITLSSETIHNPSEPRHFMRLRPVKRLVRVLLGDRVLVESRNAVRLIEVGKDVYEPVLYFPADDVTARLAQAEGSTHCPLKGDAVYFDLAADGDHEARSKIAWSYPEPFDFAPDLAGLIAFYTNDLTIEECPL